MRIHSAESGSGGIGSKAGRLSVVVGEPGGHILNWHSRARGARATLKYSNQKKGHAAFATWPLILCRRRPNLPHTFACSTIGPAQDTNQSAMRLAIPIRTNQKSRYHSKR